MPIKVYIYIILRHPILRHLPFPYFCQNQSETLMLAENTAVIGSYDYLKVLPFSLDHPDIQICVCARVCVFA